MSSEVATCYPRNDLIFAVGLMLSSDCGCVPVIDYDRALIGVITDRDICRAAHDLGRTLADIEVADAMSKPPVSVRPGTTLSEAHGLMRRHRIRRLPVVDEARLVVGILSIADIARGVASWGEGQTDPGLSAQLLADTLAVICSPPSEIPPMPITGRG